MADMEQSERTWKSKCLEMDVGSCTVSVSREQVLVEIGFLRSLPADGVGIEAKLEITDLDSSPTEAIESGRRKLDREMIKDILDTMLYVYQHGQPPTAEAE